MREMIAVVIGGALAILGGFLAQIWEARRERLNQLRTLYDDVVSLIIDDEKIMAFGPHGEMPPMEHQAKQHTIAHRLTLHGSEEVRDAYKAYHRCVFQETAPPNPPSDPNAVVEARDMLLATMRRELHGGFPRLRRGSHRDK